MRALWIVVVLLASGCASPAADTTCARLLMTPNAYSFQVGDSLRVSVKIENCGSEPLRLDDAASCDGDVGAYVRANRANDSFLLQSAAALVDDSCEGSPASVTLAPGAWLNRTRSWNGTIDAAGGNRPAEPGEYEIVARLDWAREERAVVTLEPTTILRLVMNESYALGERAVVLLENRGNVAYRYRTHFAACDLEYFVASSSRPFIIPPGTHCDIANDAALGAGEIVSLFSWNLDECVEDNWGCARAQPLGPGEYVVRGAFDAWRENWFEAPRRQTTIQTSFVIRS